MKGNIMLLLFLMAMIVIAGCINQETQSKGGEVNNEVEGNITEKIEITKVENITEIPKPVINISEYENKTKYVNYSSYNYKPTSPSYAYFLKSADDLNQKEGRAIIIKKGDFDLLIDGGIKESRESVLNLIASIADDIEVLVISSPRKENIENTKEIIDRIGVGEIWYPKEEGLEEILEYAKSKGIPTRKVKEGDVFNFNGMEFRILNPQNERSFEDNENDAIVMKVIDRKNSILITTDILNGAMGALNSEYGAALKADVLEMPFYGSRVGQSQTRLFIKNVNPSLVIIEGYKPIDLEESPKISTINLIRDVYRIEYETVWDSAGVVVIYNGKEMGVSKIEEK